MPDCCPIIESAIGLSAPSAFDTPTNLVQGPTGVWSRSGGTPGTSDAFVDTALWCEGTGCAFWYWTIQNSIDDFESNLINYFIYPEDNSTGVYGWGFSNQFVSFRRGEFLNSVGGGLIFYRNTNLGFNHFGILYNNGTVKLYETSDSALTDPGWIEPQSYGAVGLPTNTRWRLRVTVKPAASEARSSAVSEVIRLNDDDCPSPSATPSVSPSSSPSASPAPCTPPIGQAISCVNARGRLFVTLANDDATSQVAFAWHEGAERMPITSMTNWKRSMRALTLQEMGVAFETDNADAEAPLIVSVHRNLRKNYVRDARVNAGSSRIDSLSAQFDADNIGDEVAIFGHNIGGVGVDYIIGRISAIASPSASPSPSASLSASPSATFSPSPSGSPSASPSSSRSGSPSPSHSPSASPSSSPSRSGSSSPSASPSSSRSASPSSSISASPSAS